MATMHHKIVVALFATAITAALPPLSAETAKLSPAERWQAAKRAEEQGDYVMLMKMLRPLADEGDATAQYQIGLMYDTGQGGKLDRAEAAKWYRKSAEHGYARAQYYLASIYYEDKGDLKDFPEAMKWFKRAAEQDTAMAQYSLGVMYTKGQGTKVDYVQAYKWLSLASKRLPVSSGTYRARAVNGRDWVAAKMTPEELVEAKRLLEDWKPTIEPEAPKPTP